MNTSEKRQLRDRWSTELTIAGQAALGASVGFPFPTLNDGRADLRGLAITQFIKNASIHSVDLSGAELQGFGQFGMCKIEQSRFSYATLPTNLGQTFKNCDFTFANLTGAVLRGTFSNCDFTSANLSSVKGTQVQFIDCVFVNTNFVKATLTHCLFEDCKFVECKFRSGSFSYSKFVRSPLTENELGNTLMENVVSI